jgi:hypothetical protein
MDVLGKCMTYGDFSVFFWQVFCKVEAKIQGMELCLLLGSW